MTSIIENEIDSAETISKFLKAVESKDEDEVSSYLDKGIDPNCTNRDGDTALNICAERNYAELAKILVLNERIKINKGNILGMTPLCTAARFGSVDCLRVLLRRRASLTIANMMLNTPLHIAVTSNHADVVRILLRYKADKTALNCFRFTPLFIAASNVYNYEITEILLKNGADPNVWDASFTMPLLLETCLSCYSESQIRIVELLINHGANVNIICKLSGNSALHVVGFTGYEPLVTVLLKHGAERMYKNRKGYTAYETALIFGHYKAAAILKEPDGPTKSSPFLKRKKIRRQK